MFGMLCAYKPELKIREFECYQAVYCGLCKEIAKSSGAFARLNLSYDLVFLAMLGMSQEETGELKVGRCMLNPLRKKSYYIQSPALTYAAHVGVLLTYHQLKDDLQDEKGGRYLRAWLALLPYRRMYRKAKTALSGLSDTIATKLQLLTAAEKAGDLSLDAFADFFASILGETFAGIAEEPQQQRILGEIGYFIGRWIYLMDAYDDLGQDMAKKRFNPLYSSLGCNHLTSEAFSRQVQATMSTVLRDTMARLSRAYELLDCRSFKPILDNIIYFSMEQKFQAIVKKELTL